MCTAEDVTESASQLRKAEEDQENYKFITEIMEINDKEKLGLEIERSIKVLFEVLEDFVSPISDTYELAHFRKQLDQTISEIQKNIRNLKSLKWKLGELYSGLDNLKKEDKGINPQVEATSAICDMLETFLSYSDSVNQFVPVNLNYNLSFTSIILEKIEDIEKIFKNLFEYVFLVREIDKIDEEKLKKVVQVAKLYPDFERTIDLIQQRSRLLSFLLKGVGEEELSSTYQNLSSKVKLMPERERLTEVIIEHNLIEPYKEVLENTKDIEIDLIIRIQERQQEILDDKGYLLLLTELMNRFVKESEEGEDKYLPSLPKIGKEKIDYFQILGIMIEDKVENPKTEKESILKYTFDVENLLRGLFLNIESIL